MIFGKYRYVVIEGPVGAGKTSLTRRLSEHFGASALLEAPEDNPFLPKFYRDMARYALPTQLYFLFQRVNQVQGLKQPDIFSGATVADFMLDKDSLFARLTLNDEEYGLYRNLYRRLQPQAPRPDLVIYLQASPETLMQRVQRRGHDFERAMPAEYLARLADGYSRFFYHYDASPLMIVNSNHLNFVEGKADFDLLLQRIAGMRGAREFFNRGE